MHKFIFFFVALLICQVDSKINNSIEFSIALKQNNISILKKNLLDISDPLSINYGKFWSIEEINKLTGTNKDDKKKVVDWLISNGIPKKDLNIYADSIYCKTEYIHNVENIFNVSFIPYNLDKKTHFLYSKMPYTIPTNLINIIEFVEGISKKRFPRISKKYNQNNVNVDTGYAAKEVVERLYSIKGDKITGNQSVGAIEYQGNSGFSQQDLEISQGYNGEEKKKVLKEHIIGYDTDFPDTESELDIQMISQTAENVDIWFWGSKNWLYTFSINFMNSKEIPDVISMSWGWAEDQQCTITNCTNITSQKYIERVNNEYIKIGLRGVSIIVSSGDAGAPGRTSESCDIDRPVNPVFPGSSPWVTSLGATFIVSDNNKVEYKTPICKDNKCATGVEQIGTSYNYTGWTAGGGFSIYSEEKLPIWQKKAVYQYLNSGVPLPSKFNKNGRSYPDISVVGHNCPVYTGGNLIDVDGTSCSAPIFASMISILNQHQNIRGKPKLGFLNPLLYKIYDSEPYVFNDISIGNNWCTEYSCCPLREDGGSDFGYKSIKGYDPVTGLGTPNISRIISWLDRNLNN